MTSWEETTSSPTQYVALDSSVSPYCQPIYYKVGTTKQRPTENDYIFCFGW